MVNVQGLIANSSLGGEKIVFCVVCFAYSLYDDNDDGYYY